MSNFSRGFRNNTGGEDYTTIDGLIERFKASRCDESVVQTDREWFADLADFIYRGTKN